jgi:hypothetical protein
VAEIGRAAAETALVQQLELTTSLGAAQGTFADSDEDRDEEQLVLVNETRAGRLAASSAPPIERSRSALAVNGRPPPG